MHLPPKKVDTFAPLRLVAQDGKSCRRRDAAPKDVAEPSATLAHAAEGKAFRTLSA